MSFENWKNAKFQMNTEIGIDKLYINSEQSEMSLLGFFGLKSSKNGNKNYLRQMIEQK